MRRRKPGGYRRRMSITALPSAPATPSSAAPWHQRLAVRHRSDFSGPDAIDIAIVVACFVVFTGPLLVGMTRGIGSTAQIAGFGVAAVAPLIVRRRRPLAVLIAVSAVLCAAALA